MLSQLVLLTAVLLGVTFVRLARRVEPGQRGYVIVVAGVLALSLAALINGAAPLGVAAIAFAVIVVVIPWLLETAARAAFTRGRLGLAVNLAGVRATLMPGAGLGRQQEILRGLALLETKGVDRALAHFRGLADESDDGGELALINEQIVSMLFYGQRWDEGIAHYEARFHPRYAAMRPALALGLLRAYGESGRMDLAASLLRALEEGPVGSDPRALGLISQARLTFLAYAGESGSVAGALTDERRRALGLSEASGTLLCGIAHERAGEPDEAERVLKRVSRVAGAKEDRVVEAARSAIARIAGHGGEVEETIWPADLGPDLQRYVSAVSERLELFLRAAPSIRRPGMLIATPALIAAVLGGYLAVVAIGRAGMGLLAAGALTPDLWHAGQWWRVFTALFAQADPIATLLNLYALWLSAPLCERVYGSARLVLTTVGGAVLGLTVGVLLEPDKASVLSGGSLLAAAAVSAALWTLLPSRTPSLPARTRRGLVIPLALVAAALALSVYPGLLALDVSPIGLIVAALFAAVSVLAIPPVGRIADASRWLAAPLLAALVAAFVALLGSNPGGAIGERRVRTLFVGDVEVKVPVYFEGTTEREVYGVELPLVEGAVDSLALRTANLVQLIESEASAECALLLAAPELKHQVDAVALPAPPDAIAEAYVEVGGDPAQLRTFAIRRNGEEVATVIERTVEDRTLALVAAPSEAADPAASVYAAVLFDARKRE